MFNRLHFCIFTKFTVSSINDKTGPFLLLRVLEDVSSRREFKKQSLKNKRPLVLNAVHLSGWLLTCYLRE